MQIKQTYLALAVLAGFGLALGACSSSSDDGPASTMLDLGGLTYTGDPQVGDVITVPAGGSVTMYGITASCPAGGPDCVITITEDGADYSGGKPTLTAAAPEPTPAEQIAALVAQINALRAQLGLDPISIEGLQASVAELTAQVDDLQGQVDDAAEDARRAAHQANQKDLKSLFDGLNRALSAAADSTANPKLVTAPAIAATHGDDTEVSFGTGTTMTLGTEDISAAVTTGLAKAKSTSLSSIGPWSGTEIKSSESKGSISNTAVVYTDIEADKPVDFEKAFDVAGGTDPLVLEIAADADSWDKHIDSSEFPQTPGIKAHGDPDKTSESFEIAGTFAGARGTYRCTESGGNTCTSQGTNTGIELSGGWTFDPDEGVKAMMADTSYGAFGWWLRVDQEGDWHIDTFNGVVGNNTFTSADFTALKDSATYEGPAAGKAVTNAQLPGQDLGGGHFTATATLTANFEGGDSDAGTISGKVHSFNVGGDQPNWEVALGKTNLATTDSGGPTFDTAASSATDDGTVWSIDGEASDSTGHWAGQMTHHGDDAVPGMTTGTFSATYNDTVGYMLGAFGARKEE